MNSKSDLYGILELEKTAQIQDGKLSKEIVLYFIYVAYKFTVKANFYRLARVHHPDRVDETQKAIAQEKFTALHKAYSVLADPDKKKLYDAGDSTVVYTKTTIAAKWDQHIQTVDSSVIQSARSKYQGSVAEQNDVLREIVIGNGSMTHLLNTIPFMRIEDESRMIEMVKEFMHSGKIVKIAIRKLRNTK